MHCIQNSRIGTPITFNKAIVVITSILTITVIALSVIGLTASPSGPFNVIVQFGKTTNGILLGTSIFVLILDLLWIAALCKKTKEQPVSQSESSQPRPSVLGLQNSKSLEQKSFQSALLPEIEEINDTDFFSRQPQQFILNIFGYLNIIELTKCGEVSRRWKRLASNATLWNAFDLRKIFPALKIFDELDWINHVDLSSFGLEVKDVSTLDKRRAIPILKRYLASLPIEENAGITLLTIPKGLTFNKLVKLAGSPKMGNSTIIQFHDIAHLDVISREVGNIQVDKTYRILITNNIFKKSRTLSVNDQKALLSKIGCEMPRLLEVTVLLVVTFMSSGEHLYSYNEWIPTYTRCLEQLLGYQFVVGCFTKLGIDIHCGFNREIDAVGGVVRNLDMSGLEK